MIGHVLQVLALNEVRLRMRRLSTIVALLAVVAISWALISDPAGGHALIVISKTRVLYTSSALALGSAVMASMLFALGGFYLVRGRTAEDIRTGAGSVIGATPVGDALFVAGRWLGGVAYLVLLALALMGTILVCHALRGDGPIQPLVYLATYCLILLPALLFAASCATLFDSWAPLMGKRGDLLFFLLWACQMALVGIAQSSGAAASGWAVFDFTGTLASMTTLAQYFDPAHTSLGGGIPFDAAKTPLLLPALPWTAQVVWMRCAAGLIAGKSVV